MVKVKIIDGNDRLRVAMEIEMFIDGKKIISITQSEYKLSESHYTRLTYTILFKTRRSWLTKLKEVFNV
jgi:hypothetical protein